MLHAVLVKGADANRAADILAGRAPEVHAALETKHAGPARRRLLKGCTPGMSLLKRAVKKARRLSATAAAVLIPPSS